MKKLYTLFLLFIAINVSKAGIIASDNFENTTNSSGCDWFSGNTVYIFSGNSNSSTDVPGSVPKYSSGAQSSGRTNGVGSYLSPTVDVSACSNLSMSFDLAAMSLGSTGNGMDWNGSTSDRVYIEISTNSGTSWSKELEIRGTNATNTTSNFYWKFSTIANPSYSYDGDNTATVIAPDNTNTTKDRFSVGDGYSKITINGLPSSNQLKIKITLQTNANNETWLIDNFVLSGNCGATPNMVVRGGPITNIADGDATPSTTDSTIFKNTCIGSSSTVTYTIRNTGTATLNLTGSPLVQLGGTNASDFSLTTAPASTVAAGDSTKFTVQFTPGAAGTRNATISIPNDDPGTAKNLYNYSIQGSGVAMSTPAVSIAITSGSNPTCSGSSVAFTATPTGVGGGTVAYQWKNNGSNVGTNSATYTTSSLSNGNIITCAITVTGGACLTSNTATSGNITMTVNSLPANPPNPTPAQNPGCTSTTLNTMSPPSGVTYFWQGTTNNGTNTSSPTSSTYTVSSTNTYYVRAQDNTSSCWSSGSGSVLVTINTPVSISPQPTDQTVTVGNTATFSLTATGTSPIYQWQVSTDGGTNWNNVSTGTGGTTNSYTTPSTTVAMNGYIYKCIVTNSCGSLTSNIVTLFVNCFNESFTSTGFPYAGWENVDAFASRITSNFRTTPACMSLAVGNLGEIRLPKVNRPSSLSFWLSRSSSNAQNKLIIQVSTVNQKTGYVQVASYTDADMASANTYYQKTIDLTAFSDYDAVFVNFVSLGTASSTTVYRVDDIQFTCSASTCSIPQNVPGAHGNPGNASAILNWYYPACFDEIMIVANTTAGINFSPSGNGSSYTANSVYAGVNSIVYKGTGTNQTVTGLTNGTTYYFEIFTRKGSNWSSGYEIKVTPEATPTHCSSDFSDISDEFISKVKVANINNSSYVYDGYADYTYIQSDVERSLDYTITVDNGQDFDDDYCYVWVDWNHDGTFSSTVGTPAGERYVMTGVGGGTAQFTGTITPPTGALEGLARMRVTLGWGLSSYTDADCGSILDYGETEDYMLNVLAPCTPDFTVSNFYPKSGTSESWIRITGTYLTNVTNISINGIAVTNYQISATEIRMELPAGATTGKIMLSNAANCKVLTSVPFTVVSPDNGSCSSGGATNLFISELYDPGSGNNHYIEIYNGTGGSVNLSGYSLQVVNISATGTFPGTSYILSGTLAANATEIVWAGSAGSLATQGGPTNGFNADDEIRLYQGASVIDRITCPTVSGYSMIRVPSVMSPSSSYVGAQWNILTNPNQSTANIGLHTFIGTSPLTITTLPTDQTVAPCDAATFSFNVSGSGVTFQWVVNDMTTDTWSNVTTGGAYTVNNTSNSTSLVVNPMAFKDSFQFYCIVTSGSCIKYVRAVQLYEGVNNKPVFRSVSTADSNWTTVANWEVATSELGPWTPACVYPKAENSTRVIISNNSYIKLNFQNDVDSLEVKPDGVLELMPGSKITINNGFTSGADYIINGTLYDNTDNSTVFNSGATWLLGDTAKVIKSRNSSTNVYRDNYQGGIANIPATAHWKIRYVGASQPSVSSIGMYYPNLYWENYTGSHVNLNNSSSTMRGGSGYATVKGSMYVGSTGVSSLSVYNNNYNAQPMLILGNLEVASNSILTTNSYNGSENEGTGFELQGDVTINGSLSIIYNSVYPTSSKLLKFSGNKSPQNLSGSGLLYLHNVEIAKSGSQYVKLNRSVNVRRNLNMNGGHFVLDVDTLKSLYSLDVLELGENAIDVGTLTISKPNSFVIGRMRRWYVAAVSSGDASSLFPIGANDTLRHIGYPDAIMNRNIKVEFTEAPSVGGALDVFFMQKDMTVSGMPIHINPVGGCTSFDAYFTENQGYWKVIPTVTLVDYKYRITAIGEGFSTIDPSGLCNLTLVKRPNNGTTWYDLGTHEEPSGTITKPILKRSGLTSFSEFGYAGGILNILPIELESFTGTCENDYIRLDWATASEYDNDYFVVEKSFDQITYIPMDTIDGAGTSNQILYYSSKDLETVPAYYRIRQVDYDGSSTLSSVIWLNCESGNLDGVQVYFDGNLINALISATNNKSYIANIYNAKGQIVYSENFNIQKGISKVPMQHNKLASGIYIVNLYDGTRQFTQKIFVK